MNYGFTFAGLIITILLRVFLKTKDLPDNYISKENMIIFLMILQLFYILLNLRLQSIGKGINKIKEK